MFLPVYLCTYVVALMCVFTKVKGDEVTIEAAYSLRSRSGQEWLFLFVGNMFRVLKEKTDRGPEYRADLAVPDDFPLQAAFVKDPIDYNTRYYYGDKYGYLIFTTNTFGMRKLKYGPARKLIRRGGPDAAGRRNGVVYFFKGCKMAIRRSWDKWELASKDVKTIGLPCNIDAAWGETEGAMVVLQGDQFWRWETNDSVNGPHAFHDTYTLTEWTLKPRERR